MYHFVCPTKYRRVVFDEKVDKMLKEICLAISLRYEIIFLEIGTDEDHVHFLIQSVPTMSPSKMIKIVKSITKLWGGSFWSSGYFVNTVGQYANEDVIRNYVKNQGSPEKYKTLHVQHPELDLKF